MNRRLHLRLATHGLAAAVGLAAGMVWWSGGKPPGISANNTPPPPSPAARGEMVSSWVAASLANARQQREGVAHYRDWEQLPIPGLLQRNRREADEEKAGLQREIDAIIADSARFSAHPDPASLIRELGRTDDAATFAAFHAWQQRDPDAAFALLCRNWRMAGDSWTMPALLEREFGRQWMMRKLHDEQTPYRLRRTLAIGLARSLAWDGDLTGMLRLYQATSGPTFKASLVSGFGSNWPLADPAETARILTTAPVELRKWLLEEWAPQPSDPFMFGHSMPPQYASVEWFRQLRAALDPALVPAAIRDNPCDPWYLKQTPEPPATLETCLQQKRASAKTEAIAVRSAMTSMVNIAMANHPEAVERFLTGLSGRAEWLEQLCKEIPGAEAYPEALERAAWEAVTARAEPRQLMSWAAELAGQEGFTEALPQAIAPSLPRVLSSEARASYALDRDRGLWDATADTKTREAILESARIHWSIWHDFAPLNAEAWRDALPSGHPLRQDLAKSE